MDNQKLGLMGRKESLVVNPVYLLITIFVAIFAAEAVIMVILNLLPPLSMYQDVILDSLSLVIIISPILYLSAFKPLKQQIKFCKEAEHEKNMLIKELKESIDEIKTLQGIIPICASCKSIRDDKGFWQQVEVYVQDHTDALFSHGLCPDCMKKLYPGITDEIDDTKS